jgi:hypothetical protein
MGVETETGLKRRILAIIEHIPFFIGAWMAKTA